MRSALTGSLCSGRDLGRLKEGKILMTHLQFTYFTLKSVPFKLSPAVLYVHKHFCSTICMSRNISSFFTCRQPASTRKDSWDQVFTGAGTSKSALSHEWGLKVPKGLRWASAKRAPCRVLLSFSPNTQRGEKSKPHLHLTQKLSARQHEWSFVMRPSPRQRMFSLSFDPSARLLIG